MLELRATKRFGPFALDVSLLAPTPGVVALFGRSGCGKTTLVRILAGLLDADTGYARLDDDILLDTEKRTAVRAEHRRIGYVFQDSRLFPHLSVQGNLHYAERRAPRAAFVSRDMVVEMLGLGRLLTRRTHQLSGGERQRVAIGRALLTQPRLLLLDEPLASLDHARRAEVLPYLELLRDQLSIPMVYVSHNFEEVLRLATHIVVMDQGGVVSQGSIGRVSRDTHLRQIIGSSALGAVIDARVQHVDPDTGLASVQIGAGELHVRAAALPVGSAIRVQILARDVILALHEPVGLSVRNRIVGTIADMSPDDADTALVSIDIGGTEPLLALVTRAAARELGLCRGLAVWALIKTVALRGHAFKTPASPNA